MGIYISGLNMPDRYAQIVIHADGSVSVFDDTSNCFQEAKAQATNVPNHGRLVDADAYQYPGDLIYEPTIIPADPGGASPFPTKDDWEK